MAFFPGMAQAEESVSPVYEPEVPRLPGDNNPPKKDKSQANSSNTGGATAPSGSEGSDPSNSESSSEDASVGGGGGSGNDGGTGQGSPGDGSKGEANQAGNQQPGGSQQGQPVRAESSDDSSSPLVPILIAIAVLALISIGAVLYRQRRQGSGSPVSPKAS